MFKLSEQLQRSKNDYSSLPSDVKSWKDFEDWVTYDNSEFRADDNFKEAEKIVYKFALDCAKDAINMELKVQEKELKKMESDMDGLVKDNENSHRDIEKWEESIGKAKKEIEQNIIDQETQRIAIENQNMMIVEVSEKLKTIK